MCDTYLTDVAPRLREGGRVGRPRKPDGPPTKGLYSQELSLCQHWGSGFCLSVSMFFNFFQMHKNAYGTKLKTNLKGYFVKSKALCPCALPPHPKAPGVSCHGRNTCHREHTPRGQTALAWAVRAGTALRLAFSAKLSPVRFPRSRR